uniref:Uncharacterized protein n=1 Tax=Sphaerodactylus townsendi TaxID=933632 RepID=A0ACB8E7A2_9SAUR
MAIVVLDSPKHICYELDNCTEELSADSQSLGLHGVGQVRPAWSRDSPLPRTELVSHFVVFHPGEEVHVDMRLPQVMDDGNVPSKNLGVAVFHFGQSLEWRMVRDQHKDPSLQVEAENPFDPGDGECF